MGFGNRRNQSPRRLRSQMQDNPEANPPMRQRRPSLRVLRLMRAASGRLRALVEALMHALDQALIVRTEPGRWAPAAVTASTAYDMVTSAGESYYADQYWAVISRHLDRVRTESPHVIDLGCGQGRLAFRAARRFPTGSVIGYDLSSSAIRSASEHARAKGLTNVRFEQAAISELLNNNDADRADLLLMTEVAFYYPDWRGQVGRITSLLRRDGLFVASFRSTYFNALHLADQGDFAGAARVAKERTGRLSSMSDVVFSWNHSAEIVGVLKQAGLSVLEVIGVGVCSGIEGDPHASIAQPGDLSEKARVRLMEAEMALGTVVPDAGRYILVIAQRSESSLR